MLRVDRSVTPTMAKTPTLAQWELDLLRTIDNVVRLGHLERVEPGRLVFGDGRGRDRRRTPWSCTAPRRGCGTRRWCRSGVPTRSRCSRSAPASPASARRWPATWRRRSTTTTRRTGCARRRRSPTRPTDWCRMQVLGGRASMALSGSPEIKEWANGVALNPTRVLPEMAGRPRPGRRHRPLQGRGRSCAGQDGRAGGHGGLARWYAAHTHREQDGRGPRRPPPRPRRPPADRRPVLVGERPGDVGEPARVGGAARWPSPAPRRLASRLRPGRRPRTGPVRCALAGLMPASVPVTTHSSRRRRACPTRAAMNRGQVVTQPTPGRPGAQAAAALGGGSRAGSTAQRGAHPDPGGRHVVEEPVRHQQTVSVSRRACPIPSTPARRRAGPRPGSGRGRAPQSARDGVERPRAARRGEHCTPNVSVPSVSIPPLAMTLSTSTPRAGVLLDRAADACPPRSPAPPR